ncbi:hypothetical protein [Gordonia zhaorongruii]|uniref:hypothetical protein n=1 Tax=Gordonia zhaorongruii TaxID=2597659 RepID=UPI001F16968B|nr:hypothetical protein [Gordonia zhaorongruii]
MLGKKKSNLPARTSDTTIDGTATNDTATKAKTPGPVVGTIVDKAQRLQQPAVTKYVNGLRRRHPDESPQQIIERLEKLYLNTVTASGGAVGATAAIPGIGTISAIGAMSAESALFIEASALLALASAEVYGIAPTDTERRRAIVLTVALGEEGTSILGKAIGGRKKKNADTVAQLDVPGLGVNLATLNKALTNRFVKKFTLGKAPVMFGKVLPGGIGAVIGSVGNRALGNAVIRNARAAFGAPPRTWPAGTVDGSLADDLPRVEGTN